MKRDEMFVTIKRIIEETVKDRIDLGAIGEETDLIEEIGLNSVEGLEILVRAESEFGFEIEDEDLSVDLMRTISNLMNYIEQKCIE